MSDDRPGLEEPLTVECMGDPDVYAMAPAGYLAERGWPEPWRPVWCYTHQGLHAATFEEIARWRRRRAIAAMSLEELDDFVAAIDEARAARLARYAEEDRHG